MNMNFTHSHVTINVRGETTLEALLLGQTEVAGFVVHDPFQAATPCWIRGYGDMHTAQCIENNDRSAREVCICK